MIMRRICYPSGSATHVRAWAPTLNLLGPLALYPFCSNLYDVLFDKGDDRARQRRRAFRESPDPCDVAHTGWDANLSTRGNAGCRLLRAERGGVVPSPEGVRCQAQGALRETRGESKGAGWHSSKCGAGLPAVAWRTRSQGCVTRGTRSGLASVQARFSCICGRLHS